MGKKCQGDVPWSSSPLRLYWPLCQYSAPSSTLVSAVSCLPLVSTHSLSNAPLLPFPFWHQSPLACAPKLPLYCRITIYWSFTAFKERFSPKATSQEDNEPHAFAWMRMPVCLSVHVHACLPLPATHTQNIISTRERERGGVCWGGGGSKRHTESQYNKSQTKGAGGGGGERDSRDSRKTECLKTWANCNQSLSKIFNHVEEERKKWGGKHRREK